MGLDKKLGSILSGGLFKGRKQESAPKTPEACEAEIDAVLKELDQAYGVEKINAAIGGYFSRSTPPSNEEIQKAFATKLPPERGQLAKDSEKWVATYGWDTFQAAMLSVKAKRLGTSAS